MRLIDADLLEIKLLELCGDSPAMFYYFSNAIGVIRDQPTAYDVDKVVEQIESLRHPYTSFEDGTGCLHEYDFYIESAKDIAKGGGIDE